MAPDPVTLGRTFLIVGAGSIGNRHLANLRQLAPQSRIVVLRRESVGDLAGTDRVVNSIAEALAERPYAAIVANPAPMHLAVAQQLAEQGCHLLIEKPLSSSLAGVGALLKICVERRVTLMVGYNLRFMPSLQRLSELLAAGEIGKIQYLRAEVGQYLPDWRPATDYRRGVTAQAELGGGALLELSHEIDLALWLGGPVVAVSANIARIGNLDIDVDDCVDLALDFASGARGSVHMDLLQRVPRRKILVAGSKGSLKWDYFTDTLRIGRSAADGWRDVEALKLADRNDMYVNELKAFLACADNGLAAPIDGAAGRNVLAVVEAARRSQQTDQTRMMIEGVS